jgi:serine/threonine-protein kinase
MPESNAVTNEQIQRQLTRIISSATFQQVDRLRRFLGFIVTETAAGRGANLKEYLVGVQVFDKDTSFDPRTDPIVRVQARRLRVRLARYYQEEGQNDEVLIELPKGGYAPTFRRFASAAAAPRRSVSAALVSRNTVAIAPFSNDSSDPRLDYFCKGLVQEITNALAGMEALRVIAWAPPSAEHEGDFRRTAEASEAAVIVVGSVRQSNEKIRITTQLVDGASGVYIWSASIDGSLDAEFRLQEEAARVILSRLNSGLTAVGGPRVRKPAENLAARNLYLQGRYHLSQRTAEGIRKAADFFEKAIAEDSQYAVAFAGLADAYGLLAHYGILPPAEVWIKAASAAATAVLLDENSVEARTSLAHVKSTQDWDWVGSKREFLHAIGLDPRYATAHHWYAMSCLAPNGELDEALEQMQVALSLDPVAPIIARDLAVVYYYQRDFEAALDRCDHAIELSPHFSPAYLTLGLIQEQRRDFDEAAAALERANHFSPCEPRIQASLARVFAKSNKRKQATRILNELNELAKTRYVSPFEFACIHFGLGKADTGIEWLRKAFEDRCFELIALNVDPRFDTWKNYSGFTELAAKLKFDGVAGVKAARAGPIKSLVARKR